MDAYLATVVIGNINAMQCYSELFTEVYAVVVTHN